jgi:uncharacterized protein (DUF169 family)
MEHWHRLAAEIDRHIRPDTFPLAVLLPDDEARIPAKARRPTKDMGKKLAPCQSAALARKYGWTVAIAAEESGCAIASHTYGWAPITDQDSAVKFFINMNYFQDEVAARAGMASLPVLEPGCCRAVVHAPLARTVFEPDLILMYVNPAQLMRLLHGITQEKGHAVASSFSGKAGSCTEGVIGAYVDKDPKVVVPGNGDRVWASAQDDEMAFVLPAAMLESLVRGLARTHERGIRYPVPVCLDYEPKIRLHTPLADVFNHPLR